MRHGRASLGAYLNAAVIASGITLGFWAEYDRAGAAGAQPDARPAHDNGYSPDLMDNLAAGPDLYTAFISAA